MITLKQFAAKLFSPIWGGGRGRTGNVFVMKEPFAGAWQRNLEATREDMLSFHAIYACISLISSSISKMNVRLVRKDADGIWSEYESSAYSPCLRRPNSIQNRIQFYSSWVTSVLTSGSAYILKKRDARRVVTELFVLDPNRVVTLVSPSGQVVYELQADSTAGLEEPVRVPASEVIVHRINCFYSPLVGLSPIYAAALPVLQGIEIQKSSAAFFQNNARPGGVLTAPGAVSDETVEQLKTVWEANYTGLNAGKVAVLADGLTYKSFDVQSAANNQVVEQLEWSARVVASVFHVPYYMISGEMPSSENVEALQTQFYTQCLQSLIEQIELCLSEGLGVSGSLAVEFDLDGLLRLDQLAQMEWLDKASGKLTVNEMRKILNRKPLTGGDSVFLQQQNYSLEALAKRDASPNPFGNGGATNDNGTLKAGEVNNHFNTLNKLRNLENAA
ncbi:phage portal protein [Devosia insulae DS-56]|uniref:Phage portal protein n=1 Tax=Devosia insulae DS-56 TaxID=1116389 RepID=A0A1E5XQL4_9HYPH|nr:phage portal protein [Devosia insulae]OEO30901.1 phage portal protein [Devosia insulae DS-56]